MTVKELIEKLKQYDENLEVVGVNNIEYYWKPITEVVENRPWDFPGMSTGVGCHCLLRIRTITHCIFRMMLSINSQPFFVAGWTRIIPISQEK